jgi:hypothetical protein
MYFVAGPGIDDNFIHLFSGESRVLIRVGVLASESSRRALRMDKDIISKTLHADTTRYLGESCPRILCNNFSKSMRLKDSVD